MSWSMDHVLPVLVQLCVFVGFDRIHSLQSLLHKENPVIFLVDLLLPLTLALISISPKFLGRLYATMGGFLKHLFSFLLWLVITSQCFLATFETCGSFGWYVITIQ